MNRSVHLTASAVLIAAAGLGPLGCVHTRSDCGPGSCKTTADCRGMACRAGGTLEDCYRNWVDTTWPEHYNYAARQAVLAPFAQQAANGQFLNQSIWNWYFEPGTAELNAAGRAKLDSLARASHPDPKVYVQLARDLPYTPENADKYAEQVNELTVKRVEAVRKYLASHPGTAGYEIAVHNAPTPALYAPFGAFAFRTQTIGYVGGLNLAQMQQGGAGGLGLGGLGGGAISGAGGLLQGGATVGGPGTPQGATPPPSGDGSN